MKKLAKAFLLVSLVNEYGLHWHLRSCNTSISHVFPQQALSESGEHRYVYNMNHPKRGYAVIFKIVNFQESKCWKMGERHGSNVDAKNLKEIIEYYVSKRTWKVIPILVWDSKYMQITRQFDMLNYKTIILVKLS